MSHSTWQFSTAKNPQDTEYSAERSKKKIFSYLSLKRNFILYFKMMYFLMQF